MAVCGVKQTNNERIFSNDFDSNASIKPNVYIPESAWLYCMNQNTYTFWGNKSLDCSMFRFQKEYDALLNFPEQLEIIKERNINFVNNDNIPLWYLTLDLCKRYVIIHKNYGASFDNVSYESLPDNCKKLLSNNIEILANKCDLISAQKLSLLTAINAQWDDALCAMKKITSRGALSHKYNLTEALFILHLNPKHPNVFRRVFYNDEYQKDMMFYAKCITGVIACILKFEKEIPEDFDFDIIPSDDVKQCFTRNVSKLIKEYSKKFKNSNKIEQKHVKEKQD